MSRYRRTNTPGATYFFTAVTYRRQPFLCDPDVRIALREAISKVRDQYPFHIDGWVLLPDHLHTIWTLPPGDACFSLRWQQIKRGVTLRCGERLHQAAWMTESKIKHRESSLWQPSRMPLLKLAVLLADAISVALGEVLIARRKR